MIIETFENGDYITLEKDCVCSPWLPFYRQIKEIYTRYDKNNNFICSWWEYIPC